MTIKNTLLNFFFYLRNPKVPQSEKSIITIKSFFILFIFSMITDYLLNLISSNSWLINNLKINNIETHVKEIYSKGFWYCFIVIVLVGPLIEELLLRSYIKSFIWNYCLVPINIGIIIIGIFQIRGYSLLVICPGILILNNLIFTKISNFKRPKLKYLKFYIKKYHFYFYLSAITFGTLHINNYQIEHLNPFLTIFLVLPQISAGLFLGYIRIFMGLQWSISFHALHNLFFLILLFINH